MNMNINVASGVGPRTVEWNKASGASVNELQSHGGAPEGKKEE